MSTPLHMPAVPPPPAGADRDAHYAAVAAATTVAAAPVANAGLEITVSNAAAYGELYAFTGGLATYYPPGKSLPTEGAEPSPGEGTVVIQSAPADVVAARKKLPPGVPAPHRVLYLNVTRDTFLAAVDALVRALPQGELERAWDKPSSPASKKVLEDYYLERVGKGERSVFVAAGELLGEAGYRLPGDPASGAQLTLRLQDAAGSDLSPVLHLRALPSLEAKRWKGHPLAAAVANVVVPVDIHLKFEVWQSGDTYLPLPAGVRVELVDYDIESPNDVLAAAATDAQGQVHFSIPNLGAVDEKEPDLFFRVRTSGMRHAGHTLPDEWVTKGWRATDGSPGYYPDFAGTRLGDASTPLVFRIGVDFHVRLTFRHKAVDDALKGVTLSATKGSAQVTLAGGADARLRGTTLRVQGEDATYRVASLSGATLTLDRLYEGATGHGKAFTVGAPAVPGMPVGVWTHPPAGLPPQAPEGAPGSRVALLRTDANAEVHGITFGVEAGENLYFGVELEAEDPAVSLPRAEAGDDFRTWMTSWSGADQVVFMSLDTTSVGTAAQPVLLRAVEDKVDVALYALKILRELHVALRSLTGGAWAGLEPDLHIHLWAPVRSFSWPQGSVWLDSESHWNRGVIAHELSHQVMWKVIGPGAWTVVWEEFFGKLELTHYDGLLYSRMMAMLEGWGAFWERMFDPDGPTPPGNCRSNSIVHFTQGSKQVTSPQQWWGWKDGSLHVDGENTWYRVLGPSPSIGDWTSYLELDRAYEGPSGSGKFNWLHRSVVDERGLGEFTRPLFPMPPGPLVGDGELVEGDFVNALWMVWARHIAVRPDASIAESVNGDVTQTAPWITSATVVDRFNRMLWEPFRDLRPAAEPDSRRFFENMRARNPGEWHKLHREIMQFDILPAVPTVSGISPATGPAVGGQTVTITGNHFITGAEVRIGGTPATNVSVVSPNTLTADTPPGAAGAADVEVRTLSGTGKLAGGYTYA